MPVSSAPALLHSALINGFKHFSRDQTGAVTVDWVVLAAAVTGLGLGATAAVRSGAGDMASDVESSLTGAQVASLGALGDDGYTGPYIAGSGRGYVDFQQGGCDKSGLCTESVETTYMTYQMEDGSWWSMVSISTGGGEPIVTWTDDRGNIVDAPRFRS